jgi:hypothetical protein
MFIRLFSVALAQVENPGELMDIAVQKIDNPANKTAIHPLLRGEIQSLADATKDMLAHPATKSGDLKGMSDYAESQQEELGD